VGPLTARDEPTEQGHSCNGRAEAVTGDIAFRWGAENFACTAGSDPEDLIAQEIDESV